MVNTLLILHCLVLGEQKFLTDSVDPRQDCAHCPQESSQVARIKVLILPGIQYISSERSTQSTIRSHSQLDGIHVPSAQVYSLKPHSVPE